MFLLVVAAAGAADDCVLTESDYYEIREQLRSLRRSQAHSLGVAAEGSRCERALEAVMRNGPFLGVHRVETPAAADACVATLRPGADGWDLTVEGECRGDPSGPSQLVSVGAWLPLGVSARFNQDLGEGVSLVLDYGWHPPRLSAEDNLDLGPSVGPDVSRTSTMRGLVGLDFARTGLVGPYVGARGGIEASTPPSGPEPVMALVSFVGGHKWMANGVALQAGGGLLCEVPVGQGVVSERLSPVVELRAGFTNRR